MKPVYSILMLAFVVMFIFSCSHERNHSLNAEEMPAMQFHTTLSDSLPSKTFKALKVGNVSGIKIVNLTGLDVRYFEYKADADILISALSKSPFRIESAIADTFCRRLSQHEMEFLLANVADAEAAHAKALFAATENYEAYECKKSPVTHHLVIDRLRGKILHRIAMNG